MTVLQVKNKNTSTYVSYNYEYSWVRTADKEKYINDPVINEILYTLFTQDNDRITRYDDLFEIIENIKSKEYLNSGSENQIVNQYIFKVRKLLDNIGINNLILTQRGQGYKINPEWCYVSSVDDKAINSDKKYIIANIRQIVKENISYVKENQLNHSVSGWSFIRGDDRALWRNFVEINSIYNFLIDAFSKPGNGYELSEIRKKIVILSTYCFFWRVGDGIIDAKWKADYENEINYLSEQLINLIVEL